MFQLYNVLTLLNLYRQGRQELRWDGLAGRGVGNHDPRASVLPMWSIVGPSSSPTEEALSTDSYQP